MPQGLQVLDAAGATVFDPHGIITRLVASVRTNATNGSYTVTGESSETNLFAFGIPVGNYDGIASYPLVSINGKVVTWVYKDFTIGSSRSIKVDAIIYIGTAR